MEVSSEKSSLKILIALHSLERGGTEKVASELIHFLTSNGHSVTVLTVRASEKDSFIMPKSCERLSPQRELGRFRKIWHFSSLLRRHVDKQDVILSLGTPINMLVAFTLLILRENSIPLVISERGDFRFQTYEGVFVPHLLRNYLYRRRVSMLFVQTEAAKLHFQKILKDCIVRVKNNILGSEFQIQESIRELGEKAVISVGRLTESKNHAGLIAVWPHIRSQFPDWRLWIVGDGPCHAQLKEMIEDLDLGDCVSLLGDQPQVNDLYKAASIFALNSSREGLPNALIEAMSCGLACLVAESSDGVRALISNGDTGLLYEVGNDRDLVASLKHLISNPDFCRYLGLNAALKIKEMLRIDPREEWANDVIALGRVQKRAIREVPKLSRE